MMTVKTLAEINADRVRVTVELLDRSEVAEDHSGCNGMIEGLRDRVSDLEQDLATAQRAREIETKRANDAEETLALYDDDRRTERNRADRHAAHVHHLVQRVAELEQELEKYRKAHVCTDRCTANAHVAFEGNALVKLIEQELADARTESRRYREEMERRFTTAQVEDAKAGAREDARAEAHREVEALADQLGKINGAVLGTDVRMALDTSIPYPDRFETVARALHKVRTIMGVTWGSSPTS